MVLLEANIPVVLLEAKIPVVLLEAKIPVVLLAEGRHGLLEEGSYGDTQ